jgi:hypothetical protein
MKQRLAGGGRLRSVLFLSSGMLLLFEVASGWLPGALALVLFVLRLGAALYNPRQS